MAVRIRLSRGGSKNVRFTVLWRPTRERPATADLSKSWELTTRFCRRIMHRDWLSTKKESNTGSASAPSRPKDWKSCFPTSVW